MTPTESASLTATPEDEFPGNELDTIQQRLVAPLFLRTRPTDAVSHYTNVAGVHGILGTNQLWATDVRFLNDSSEYDHGLDLSRQCLADRKAAIVAHVGQTVCEAWERTILMPRALRTYVVSFCEDGDLLSQWRGYSAGSGYSIEFSPLELMQAMVGSDDATSLFRVVYSDEEKRGIVMASIDTLIARSHLVRAECGGDDEKWVSEMARAFVGHVLAIAGVFKNNAFREENEWRIVIRTRWANRSSASIGFRLHSGRIIPFTRFPLVGGDATANVKSVVVGPCTAPTLASAGLEDYLKSIDRSVVIRQSAIPYRSW